ncbi:MAG TPA: hypothetical protein VFC54_01210 [Pseudolabrys sp.]|nr:hypothetical protein [Pseudolabrys sp.]
MLIASPMHVWTPETVSKMFEVGPMKYTPRTKMPEQTVGSPAQRSAARSLWLAGLASKRLSSPPDSDKLIFEKHMAPWIGRFFTDLENTSGANFYKRVGALGRTFIEIEAEAFSLPA